MNVYVSPSGKRATEAQWIAGLQALAGHKSRFTTTCELFAALVKCGALRCA